MTNTEIIDLLSSPELRRLFDGARRRLEHSASLSASFTILDPEDAERRAVGRLLGTRPSTGRAIRVSLDRLNAALTSSRFGIGLVEALELMGGPVADRRAERETAARAKQALWEELMDHPSVIQRPGLADWLQRLRSTGLASRLATGKERELVTAALDLVGTLPRQGDRLNVVAASCTGDSHALDRGTPLGALAVNALAHLASVPSPSTAPGRRALWTSFGVVCDELSCDVLTLALEPASTDGAGVSLHDMRAAGQPMRLTLRHVSDEPKRFTPTTVFVCENPVVVAETADALGSSSPPVVCTEGVPNTAALLLLEHLLASDCRLVFHGDFDWGGVKIFNQLLRKFGDIRPWRFGHVDYLEAADRLGAVSKLEGSPVEADWDASLKDAMVDRRTVVFEEQVLNDLIHDLHSAIA